MKLSFLLLALALAASAQVVAAQNTVKLFDATPISFGSGPEAQVYAAKQVFLTCELRGKNTTMLTGPGGGPLVVRDGIFINGEPVTLAKNSRVTTGLFSSVITDPIVFLGSPVESAYVGMDPINVSADFKKNGVYTFELAEWSSTYGNSEIYLTTTCGISTVPQQ